MSKQKDAGAFEKLEHKLAHEKGVTDPAALAASIGRKAEGAATFNKKAAAGRKAAAHDEPDATVAEQAGKTVYDGLAMGGPSVMAFSGPYTWTGSIGSPKDASVGVSVSGLGPNSLGLGNDAAPKFDRSSCNGVADIAKLWK